jgi:tripartite-type tricarboxylate transporter receptor subunit TctC
MCIRVSFAAALAVGLFGSYQAAAQDWPTRPLTLIVPFSPGGGVDASARVQAQRMSEILGQPIVVENIGAAAGMAGGQRVATAAPDGYTFLVGNTGTHAYNQSLYKKPLYNAASDFQPVGLMTESPRILIARKDLPVNNLQEFIAYAKQNQTKMQYGSAGVGSGTHLPCALLNMAMGVDITHIPYRGAGPVMQDLIGVMSAKRVPIIPDVPTTGEQGLPGVEATVWNAFFFPKGTPEPIVRKLNQAMRDTLEDPVIRKRLENFGLEIVPPEQRTPEYLAKFLPEEIARWGKVIKAAGISAD